MVQMFSRLASAYNKPDPILAAEQLDLLKRKLRSWGKEFYCFNYAWILKRSADEDGKKVKGLKGAWNKRLIPFKWNEIQRDLDNKRVKKNIIPKPRQVGLTTYELADLYIEGTLDPGSVGFLVSQKKEYALKHFKMLHRIHKYFGMYDPFNEGDPRNDPWRLLHQHLLHTQYKSKHELYFDVIDCHIICDTAENQHVGEGLTINRGKCTEVARWPHNPEETMTNFKEGIPKDGTLDIDSTPLNVGDYFYEEVQRSLNNPNPEFKLHFYEWWWESQYREKTTLKSKDLTEEEQALRKQANLDLEQIQWRRNKMIALREKFPARYPEDIVSCFLAQGRRFFPEKLIYNRYKELHDYKPFTSSVDGFTTIFKKRNVKRKYVIGADVARGIMVTSEDTDFSAAKVIDEETGEEVASFRGRIPPEDFGALLAELGEMYNDAMIAVERNGDGYSTMLALNQVGYGNIYRHRQWEDRHKKTVIELPGWPNTMITRPIACNRLRDYLEENITSFYDKVFLNEASKFGRNAKTGKHEGLKGTHDDTVFASAIAHYVRLVNLGFIDPLESTQEDYGDRAA